MSKNGNPKSTKLVTQCDITKRHPAKRITNYNHKMDRYQKSKGSWASNHNWNRNTRNCSWPIERCRSTEISASASRKIRPSYFMYNDSKEAYRSTRRAQRFSSQDPRAKTNETSASSANKSPSSIPRSILHQTPDLDVIPGDSGIWQPESVLVHWLDNGVLVKPITVFLRHEALLLFPFVGTNDHEDLVKPNLIGPVIAS